MRSGPRAIRGLLDEGRPLLGICLGMQWLFEGSDEAPECPGLGVFPGRCYRLRGDASSAIKIPHVGWNSLAMTRDDSIVDGVAAASQVYFTHSYVAPVTGDTVAADRAWRGVCLDRPARSGGRRPVSSGEVGRRRSPGAPQLRADAQGSRVLSKRLIACLDVRDGQVVKGINFEGLRNAGDPAELARRYNRELVDELVILDITATLERRRALADTIRAVARELFIPLAVGGGIRTETDAAAAIDAGADKVSLNTAAMADPSLITTLANRYGSQAVIVAIDAKRAGDHYAVYVRSGQLAADRDAVDWAKEAESRGAGEILLTSIDRDGTKAGFDCGMTAAVSTAVSIPVIASGGAGGPRALRRRLHPGRRRRRARRVDLSLRRNQRSCPERAPARPRHPGAALTLTC